MIFSESFNIYAVAIRKVMNWDLLNDLFSHFNKEKMIFIFIVVGHDERIFVDFVLSLNFVLYQEFSKFLQSCVIILVQLDDDISLFSLIFIVLFAILRGKKYDDIIHL